MGTPQIIMIVLFGLTLGIALAKNGESKGQYSFGCTLVAAVIEIAILWWGGFWN